MLINELLFEGGNVFQGTSSIKKEDVPKIMTTLQASMPKGIKIIKVGSAGHKDLSGDIDAMVDESQVLKFFQPMIAKIRTQLSKGKKKPSEPIQIARHLLKEYFQHKGFDAAQTGINVHVKVPNGNEFAQVDIMLVEDSSNISIFHQHDYTGQYKGKHKHQLLSSIAKVTKSKNYPFGLMWSAFQGLFSRDASGKKDKLITRNPDTVAKMLLGPGATVKDLGNVEKIIDAIPDKDKELKLKAFKDDMAKEGIRL